MANDEGVVAGGAGAVAAAGAGGELRVCLLQRSMSRVKEAPGIGSASGRRCRMLMTRMKRQKTIEFQETAWWGQNRAGKMAVGRTLGTQNPRIRIAFWAPAKTQGDFEMELRSSEGLGIWLLLSFFDKPGLMLKTANG